MISRTRVAEVLATGPDGQRRGSGYRVSRYAVLTAGHVVADAITVVVRFEADLPGEWSAQASSWWTSTRSDVAVVSIPAGQESDDVAPARFGRIGDRAAVVPVQAVGFPLWKLRDDEDIVDAEGVAGEGRSVSRYRDAHHAVGSVAVLSNWRQGTLEVVVAQPPAPSATGGSPWEGMSGAALWVGDRIVGVISAHHPQDGLARLAASRLDIGLQRLDDTERSALHSLLPVLASSELPDVLPATVEDRVIGAYQAQLLDTAPVELHDRTQELAELVRFCAGDEPYAWLQAGPWAGKTALTSWFALHPPAGVEIVFFFVTSRFAAQSDSEAFTDAMLEQLSALADEPPLGAAEGHARRGHMLRLLQVAAHRVAAAGRRLLILVDGLDEDSSAGDGLRSSIATLLPRRLPPETRVLVTSRPSPSLPDDVPGDHPLRHTPRRQLSVSKHASDVELAAKVELTRLLAGSQFQRDVLGLITISGGGLTVTDLEHLTDRPRYEVDRLLAGHFGRSTTAQATRVGAADRSDEPVYGLSHSTLRESAREQFGRALATYRDRLHRWAEGYHAQGWPVDTPGYLLRGYHRMLIEVGDVGRLTALVVDEARHERMLNVTGGDAAALAEVEAATAVVSAQPIPDLASLLLLAVTREKLGQRNARLPPELPALWVAAGQPDRAVALANGIVDLRSRARAATLMISAAARSTDPALIQRCVTTAERSVRAIPRSVWRASAQAQLVRALVEAGRLGRALDLVVEISDSSLIAEALSTLLPALVAAGDHDQAAALIRKAERRAMRMADAAARAEAMAGLARVLAAAGYRDEAQELLHRARRAVLDIEDHGRRAQVLCRLAETAASLGDHAAAERLSGQIEDRGWRDQALAGLVGAAAGDRDRVSRLLAAITDPGWRQEAESTFVSSDDLHDPPPGEVLDIGWRAQTLLSAARAHVEAGDVSAAEAMAETVERLARATVDTDTRAETLAGLAMVLGSLGSSAALQRALELTQDIPNPASRLRVLTGLAGRLAAAGDLARAAALGREAEQLARRSPDAWRSRAAVKLVAALVDIGDTEQALRIAGAAERSALRIDEAGWRVKAYTDLVELVAAAGDPAWALRLAATAEEQARNTPNEVQAMTQLVVPIAGAGDRHRALRLAAEIERLALAIPNDGWRAQALSQLAAALIAVGDLDRALQIAKNITIAEWRAQVLCDGLLPPTVARSTAPRDETPEQRAIVHRVTANVLCTPLWAEVLPVVGRLEPAALRPLAAALTDAD
jgi:tetratricopeptide (TPR) repeat protein